MKSQDQAGSSTGFQTSGAIGESGVGSTNTLARATASELPSWQEISGLTPEREKTMTADERDAGIRKLLKEVEQRALREIARGDNAPRGERTAFWDPLERICAQLSMSRVKLSAFSRELTGLRAHELTDRIKARKLPTLLNALIQKRLLPQLQAQSGSVDRSRLGETLYIAKYALKVWREWKKTRSGVSRARWALELGFANASRLSRACLLAQRMSIDELEQRVVCCMVQKFFETLNEGQPQRTQSTQRTEKAGNKEKKCEATPTLADEIISEAVKEVMKNFVA
jgi:hypothetical protein